MSVQPVVPGIACPAGTTTPQTCNSNPNSEWDPTTSQCICCSLDGTAAIAQNLNNPPFCELCNLNICGDLGGYCKSDSPKCLQDPTTKKWINFANQNTGVCPSNTTTPALCNANPNSGWRQPYNICTCCKTDGTSYIPDDVGLPCQSCPPNSLCGDHNGYCKSSDSQCVQDVTTQKWSCSTCGGFCNSSCGISEWLAFQKCDCSSTGCQCATDFTQIKTWITWIIILFLVFLGIVLISYFSLVTNK